MKIELDAKVFAALQGARAGNSEWRECMRYLHLDLGRRVLVATDGHILVEADYQVIDDSNPPTTEGGNSILLDVQKKIPASWTRVTLDTEKQEIRGAKSSQVAYFGFIDVGKYVDYRRVSSWPEGSGNDMPKPSSGLPDRLSFDPGILQRVTGKSTVVFQSADPLVNGTSRLCVSACDLPGCRITFMAARL